MMGKLSNIRQDRRRNFNTSERVAMFIVSQGKCLICGCDLEPGWHADHIRPYSKGGETDVINGQALCPKCNLEKGDKLDTKDQLRHWQRNAKLEWNKDKENFLCVACPGAGKTTFALSCIEDFKGNIIIVCPTSHLKRQWADAAHKDFRIDIDYNFENRNGGFASDFRGVCTTYHAVAFQPDLYRRLCSFKDTIIIIDEIHHAGEQKTWGEALLHAFGPAIRRLLLSGTPFRSDNNKIPFVTYENNISKPDFYYGYDFAQVDNICRPVNFPKINGEATYIDNKMNEVCHSFTDKMSEEDANNVLRTALEPDGGWLNETLMLANDRLEAIRRSGHSNAGGLVLARDNVTSYANDIAQILMSLTSPKDVVVATSDQPDASQIIKDFRNSGKKWLVAVKMVSEGVDIPRLRVGVHATNVTTELFLKQAVGRISRYQEEISHLDENQESFYYIPKDYRLEAHVETIKREVVHVIDEEDDDGPSRDGPGPGPGPRSFSNFEAISSTGEEHSIFSDRGKTYTAEALEQAREVCRYLDKPITDDLYIADILDASNKLFKQHTALEKKTVLHPNKTDRESALRRSIKKCVAIISKKEQIDFNEVHLILNKRLGIRSTAKNSTCSETELESKLDLGKQWVKTGKI